MAGIGKTTARRIDSGRLSEVGRGARPSSDAGKKPKKKTPPRPVAGRPKGGTAPAAG